MTRRHDRLALVEVKRFPKGILSALPITKTEVRLVNRSTEREKRWQDPAWRARADAVKRERQLAAALKASRLVGTEG